jgi:ATP/maltotriose-dependent transcriptional regulator MalT
MIALEQGKPGEAEFLARAARDVFDKQKAVADGAVSYAVLARALLVEGRIRNAQAAANRAQLLARQSGDVIAGFESNLAAQALVAQSGRLEEAAKALESVRAQATRQGFGGFDLEARLYLGQIEMRSGKANLGRVHLRQLQSDARSKGFLLIARKAAAVQTAPAPRI